MLAFGLLPRTAAAHHVVSLNLCADEFLVTLAPEQIAGLSPLARDPALSVVARQAAALPIARADVEAVLALRPDLVLAGQFGAQAVVGLLRARGVRVVLVPEPVDFAGIEESVRIVARALGVEPRGAALITAMRADLAAIPVRPHGTAIFWQARGYTAGPGTFGHTLLARAGYQDAGTGGQMALESLLEHPPGVLVTEAAPSYPSLATDIIDNPALASLPRRVLAPASLGCPGPWSVSALRSLAQ